MSTSRWTRSRASSALISDRQTRRVAFRPLTMTKLMLRGHRSPVTRTPAETGLPFEDVAFAATDGVGLRGWFVPAGPRSSSSTAGCGTGSVYSLLRAPRPSRQDPAIPARRLDGTVVQYVQGTGEPWGELAVVEQFAAATPYTTGPVIEYPSTGRYEGYGYISERTGEVVAFFAAHL
jgi:hypothetical protein